MAASTPTFFDSPPTETRHGGSYFAWKSPRHFLEVYQIEDAWLWTLMLKHRGQVLIRKQQTVPLTSRHKACRDVERFVLGLDGAIGRVTGGG